MFNEVYFSPLFFLESLFGIFVLPRFSSINSSYGNALTGSVLSSLAVSCIIPDIDSFSGTLAMIATMYIYFCTQTIIDFKNLVKSIAIWTNCLGMSSYGIISGIAMILSDGDDFIKYTFALCFYNLGVSYSLGNRYIEYSSKLKDKLPLLMYSLSIPIGIIIGKFSKINSFNSNVLLGVSAGTFLMSGMSTLNSFSKNVSSLYLDTQEKQFKQILIYVFVLLGFGITLVLQSSLFGDIKSLVDNSNDILNTTIDTNLTSIMLNSTDTNLTNSSFFF